MKSEYLILAGIIAVALLAAVAFGELMRRASRVDTTKDAVIATDKRLIESLNNEIAAKDGLIAELKNLTSAQSAYIEELKKKIHTLKGTP